MPWVARLLTLALVTTFCSTLTRVTARVLTDDSHSADSHEHTFQCGNTHVGADRQAEIEAPIQQALAQRQSQRLAATSQPTAEDDAAFITVPVYWHVIYQVHCWRSTRCGQPSCAAAHPQSARDAPCMNADASKWFRDSRKQQIGRERGRSMSLFYVLHPRLMPEEYMAQHCQGVHSPTLGTPWVVPHGADDARSQAEDVADGYYPDSTIAAQIGVLNSVYNGVGFEFVLAGVDRTLNADWFQNLQSQTQEEADMTTLLHQGNATTVRGMHTPCRAGCHDGAGSDEATKLVGS